MVRRAQGARAFREYLEALHTWIREAEPAAPSSPAAREPAGPASGPRA